MIDDDAPLTGDVAIGAAGMLVYLRDLITISGKASFTREELLVIFETISRDPEIFAEGQGILLWEAEDV